MHAFPLDEYLGAQLLGRGINIFLALVCYCHIIFQNSCTNLHSIELSLSQYKRIRGHFLFLKHIKTKDIV